MNAGTIFLVVAALPIFFLCIAWANTSPYPGVMLVLVVYLFEAVIIETPYISIGMNVYPQDLVFLSLAIVGCLRFMIKPNFNYEFLLIISLLLIFLISFTQGVFLFGPGNTWAEGRKYFYLLTGTFYFMTFSYRRILQDNIAKLLFIFAGLISLLCVFRWCCLIVGIPMSEYVMEMIKFNQIRLLNASQAMFLAQVLFLLVYFYTNGILFKYRNFLLGLLAVVVLVVQHRTVWVISITGILIFAVGEQGQKYRLLVKKLIFSIIFVSTVTLLFYKQLEPVLISLQESVSEVSTERSTISWRTESTAVLIKQLQSFSLKNYVLGQPFGTGYERVVFDTVIDVTPHNFYLQTIFRLGVTGLIFLLALYSYAIRLAIKLPLDGQGSLSGKLFWLFLLCGSLIYNYPYAPSYDQSIFLGIGLSIFRSNNLLNVDSDSEKP